MTIRETAALNNDLFHDPEAVYELNLSELRQLANFIGEGEYSGLVIKGDRADWNSWADGLYDYYSE